MRSITGSAPSTSAGGSRGDDVVGNTNRYSITTSKDELLPNWTAPEVIMGRRRRENCYTQAADVYSFALVLWEIYSRKVPFADYKGSRDQLSLAVSLAIRCV